MEAEGAVVLAVVRQFLVRQRLEELGLVLREDGVVGEGLVDDCFDMGDLGADERHGGEAVGDALVEPDVVLVVLGGPEVDAVNGLVRGVDAVDAAKALDDADGVPVDVVVDDRLRVLEVLAFADAVGGDQNLDRRGEPRLGVAGAGVGRGERGDHLLPFREGDVPLASVFVEERRAVAEERAVVVGPVELAVELALRGKAPQDVLEGFFADIALVGRSPRDRRSAGRCGALAVHAGDAGELRLQVVVEVDGGVGVGGEDDDLPPLDPLVAQDSLEFFELGVDARAGGEFLRVGIRVGLERLQVRDVGLQLRDEGVEGGNLGEADGILPAEREVLELLPFFIGEGFEGRVRVGRCVRRARGARPTFELLVVLGLFEGVLMRGEDVGERDVEGMPARLEALGKKDAHHLHEEELALPLVLGDGNFLFVHVGRRHVRAEGWPEHRLLDVVERLERAEVADSKVDVDGLVLLREAQRHALRVLDHFAGSRDNQPVREVEELRRQGRDEVGNFAVGRLEPFLDGLLRDIEEALQRRNAVELLVVEAIVRAARKKLELVAHVDEAAVDRRRREFQHLDVGRGVGSEQAIHKVLVAARLVVAQVVAFVDHEQELAEGVEVGQLELVVAGLQPLVLEVGVESHLVMERVALEAGAGEILVLGPVLLELLGTENDSRVALVLEVLDDLRYRYRAPLFLPR